MTDREFVRGIYPNAKVVRWYANPKLMAIQLTKPDPFWYTLGWDYYENTRQAWNATRKMINRRMLKKLES